jgi:hypothetical protein
MKKTITLTALLISGNGFASTKSEDVVQQQNVHQPDKKTNQSEFKLVSDLISEEIEVLNNNIDGKRNIADMNDAFSPVLEPTGASNKPI